MSEPKSKNIVWHEHTVSKDERERISGHRGCTVWFTGLSGSGKSTLANLLEKALWERGVRAFVLDGDNIRHGLNKDLGFSPKDRTENIRRIGEVAKLFTEAGVINVTAFISPYRADRDLVRGVMKAGDFIGSSAPYEAPEKPELTVNTTKETPEQSVAQLISYLEKNSYLNA